MTAPPHILVTPCRRPAEYHAAVERAGGLAVTPVLDADFSTVLDGVSGVVLTGGADIDPSLYGEAPHPSFEATEPGRDAFEIALARAVIAADVPLLAICRGLQVLNVACGGSLVQDIPDEWRNPLPHDVKPATAIAHTVAVAPGSLLFDALGAGADPRALDVNSRHHQAAGRIGDDLRTTAVAPDGIVEALEHERMRFGVAVQWHPESYVETGRFAWLFHRFLEACRLR